MKKHQLTISGFPRSGNTFLRYALWQSFCPDEEKLYAWHTARKINESDNIFVPLRKPLDALVSFSFLGQMTDVELHTNNAFIGMLKYYVRLNKTALQNKHKIILLDFDIFTQNTDYIYDKADKYLAIRPVQTLTAKEVLDIMSKHNKHEHIPRDNAFAKISRAEYILEHFDLIEANNVYHELKMSA